MLPCMLPFATLHQHQCQHNNLICLGCTPPAHKALMQSCFNWCTLMQCQKLVSGKGQCHGSVWGIQPHVAHLRCWVLSAA